MSTCKWRSCRRSGKSAISAVWLGLGAPLLGLLPIAALVIYWTVRRTTRPILEVQRQIRMRDGEHLDPIDPHGLPGELTPIIQDMNRLLERLKAALDAERSFAANSAHELRNPIAAARAQAEIIADSLRNRPDHARAMKLIEDAGAARQSYREDAAACACRSRPWAFAHRD